MRRSSLACFRVALLWVLALTCLVSASCRSPIAQTLWNAVDDDAEDYDE